MNKKVIALPASGGAAGRFHERARHDRVLRAWMTDQEFELLDAGARPEEAVYPNQDRYEKLGEAFARLAEVLITNHQGVSSA